MRVGLFYFPTDYGIDIRELARAAEERGFESLFLPEHTHNPKSRRTPYPGGGELPKAYSMCLCGAASRARRNRRRFLNIHLIRRPPWMWPSYDLASRENRLRSSTYMSRATPWTRLPK
jgi:alkanesulfonate monooxygenase SsuD/methylene tetrahydromethanopterin reductase-like flavin-dependent oxidoreductase (luciferase family)